MSSFADKQTLDDLNLLGRYKQQSVLRLFDTTVTAGGRKLMDELFHNPLADAVAINRRSRIFAWFSARQMVFPFTERECAVMENYFSSGSFNNRVQAAMAITRKKVLRVVGGDKDFDLLKADVLKTIELLNRFRGFVEELKGNGVSSLGATAVDQADNDPYREQLDRAGKIFQRLSWLTFKDFTALSFAQVLKYDYLLRSALRKEMQQLMSIIFEIDVYLAVAQVALRRGFSYGHALPATDNVLDLVGFFHPGVENAVENSIRLDNGSNVIFLTGANMAGKSTLMKAFGICMYLAHIGFPVPAAQMRFSVKEGLFTSINVPDNLSMGFSHFYAEVLRVKKVAEEVAGGRDLVVIFDELFKGTNVKDAYDATLAITAEFARNRNCFFVISTHITEVGEALQQEGNIQFSYMPTVMQGLRPTYLYRLATGISKDRHGMMIIESEGILDIIRLKTQ